MITTSDVAEATPNMEAAEMGKVNVNVEIFNPYDEDGVRNGVLKPEQIRHTTIETLVDTGASLVSIPEVEIIKLGLPVVREAVSRYANGQKSVRKIYGPVRIKVMGREDHVLVMASHPGMPALLGQLALEGLDLVVDPKRQQLLPGHPDYPNEQLIEMY
ncbi:MAG TPA: retroviral-like aspartic protease family protein [Planctomycetota bacterium]|nr:retroviral-like aspartic protease family protein [Planctomycetota bacterium]